VCRLGRLREVHVGDTSFICTPTWRISTIGFREGDCIVQMSRFQDMTMRGGSGQMSQLPEPGSDEAVAEGEGRGGGARFDAELGQDDRDAIADGLVADEEGVGYLLVRVSLDD
jgi:hypothetical protein